jgi:hypothetical protein
VVSFHQVSPLKPCMHLSSPPYVPHVLPISVVLTSSPEWYLVRSTEHKALCYAVFSTRLLPHPCRLRTNMSALSQTFTLDMNHNKHQTQFSTAQSRRPCAPCNRNLWSQPLKSRLRFLSRRFPSPPLFLSSLNYLSYPHLCFPSPSSN